MRLITALGFVLFSVFSACNFHDARNIIRLRENVTKVLLLSNNASGGTGFFVNLEHDTAFVLTNAHVCGSNSRMIVVSNDVTRSIFKVIKSDIVTDLCLLRGDKKKVRSGLRVARMVTPLTRATMMGFALLEQLNLQHGYVTDYNKIEVLLPVKNSVKKCPNGADPFWFGILEIPLIKICVLPYYVHQTTFQVYPGNSGSPVVNDDGDVIGVVSGAHTFTHYGHVVPLNSIRAFLNLDGV